MQIRIRQNNPEQDEQPKRPSKASLALQFLSTGKSVDEILPFGDASQTNIKSAELLPTQSPPVTDDEITPGMIMDQMFGALIEQLAALEEQVSLLTRLAAQNGWFPPKTTAAVARQLQEVTEDMLPRSPQVGKRIMPNVVYKGKAEPVTTPGVGIGIVVKPQIETGDDEDLDDAYPGFNDSQAESDEE